jgi:hypothetical protein
MNDVIRVMLRGKQKRMDEERLCEKHHHEKWVSAGKMNVEFYLYE